ncbi:hypothetical protein [Arthrobacter sp. NQ4]|uniref:hypothetical protein n=1 Tax=Arthrobacter sp. NQ4 TaxID=3027930 RepID=UPI0023B1F00D|nr:hypothetical protein [Arthrobacter sp. NQ4]MDE8586196.1 hypothetical protein [Arthrobacter sp. NQ4]
MAVAIIMEFDGSTLEQYDEINKKMGLTPGGPGPAGSISHWATATDKGFQVTDVWESREQFDTFAQEKIGPLSMELGFAAPPKLTFHEVHNYLTSNTDSLRTSVPARQ